MHLSIVNGTSYLLRERHFFAKNDALLVRSDYNSLGCRNGRSKTWALNMMQSKNYRIPLKIY